jgi:hypothetical protein
MPLAASGIVLAIALASSPNTMVFEARSDGPKASDGAPEPGCEPISGWLEDALREHREALAGSTDSSRPSPPARAACLASVGDGRVPRLVPAAALAPPALRLEQENAPRVWPELRLRPPSAPWNGPAGALVAVPIAPAVARGAGASPNAATVEVDEAAALRTAIERIDFRLRVLDARSSPDRVIGETLVAMGWGSGLGGTIAIIQWLLAGAPGAFLPVWLGIWVAAGASGGLIVSMLFAVPELVSNRTEREALLKEREELQARTLSFSAIAAPVVAVRF